MKTKYIILLFAIFSAGIVAICPRTETHLLLSQVLLLFVFAFLLAKYNNGLKDFLRTIVLLQLPFLLLPPLLSDDYFRFLWDAKTVSQGLSPYAYLPKNLLKSYDWHALYYKLNSPGYYSVYPPSMQSMFYAAYKFFGFLPFYIALKFIFFIVEVLCYRYIYVNIKSIAGSRLWLSFVAFSPLVVIEGLGNLHFESIMMLLFLVSLIYFRKKDAPKNIALSAFYAGTSFLTKLTVAPAFLLFIQKGKKPIFLFGLTLIFCLGISIFFIDNDAINAKESYALYFGTFEFNASLYYIIRAIGEYFVGYNIISVYGTIFKFLLVAYLALSAIYIYVKEINLQKKYFLISGFFMLYFFLNPTLHPWYLMVPLFLSVLTQHRLWVYWSLCAFLSYFFYKNYQQIGWWLYAEYLSIIALLIVDKLFYKKLIRHLPHSKGGIQ